LAAALVFLPAVIQLGGRTEGSSVHFAFPEVPEAPGALETHKPDALGRGPIRLLVLSPHPDDATLSTAGMIQRVMGGGGAVRVVQMTSGDAFGRGVAKFLRHAPVNALSYRFYGTLREHEAIRAMRELGVRRSQVRFLGFPDEGLCVLASTSRIGAAFESPYTKRASPPGPEQLVHGTMYRGIDLELELEKIIEEFRPTLVVLPDPRDEHPDHCSTHLLGHDALAAAIGRGLRPPRILHYVIHFPNWPLATGHAQTESSVRPITTDGRWESLRLTRFEQARKQRAIESFRSQMAVMPDFLTAFAHPDEKFVEGDPAMPPPCWCDGVNITAPPVPPHAGPPTRGSCVSGC
jgi:N-acetyl-1-D-myo-inositol-2-amino-2-deoxy-alpha-D-glucopyranoside deacetylase